MHPADYPPPPVEAEPQPVQHPHSPAEIAKLYSVAETLSRALAVRLLMLLDLTTGAGARANELTDLRGAGIRQVSVDDQSVVQVALTSQRSGLTREVPVLDPAKAHRLLHRANEVGPANRLLPGTKNAANSIQGHIRRAGTPITVSAARLRHAWIVDMATQQVPTALLIALADIGDSHTLAALSGSMPGYPSDQAVRLLRGAKR